MKFLVLFLLTLVGENLGVVVRLNINSKENAKELLFIDKVRNYITDNNTVNRVYLKEVGKKCFNASDEAINHLVGKCGVEKSTPEETAANLYECVVKETEDEHLDDNKEIHYQAGLCQLKLINFFENGGINQQVVMAKLIQEGENEERAEKIVKNCSENQDTPEETANNFIVCLDKEYNLTNT